VESYDLVIIGSGPAGEVGAIRASQLGLKVALIEKEKHLGGTCLNWGCIPTKALLHAATTYDKLQKVADQGFEIGEVSYQWDKILSRKETIVDQQRKGLVFLMKKNKVTVYEGLGKLKDRNTVQIGDSTTIQAKNILLATGSRVRELPFAKADGELIHNSDTVLSIKKIPKSMGIIGGGVIGCEFASLFSRFGTEVHIIELFPQILPTEDDESVAEVTRNFKKYGVKISTNAKVKGISKSKDSVTVEFEDGKKHSFENVLVSIGREAVTANIGIEACGVKRDERSGFITVNEHYQTAVPHIYAVGDIINTPALAHTASAEAMHAVERIAGHHPPVINYDANPTAIYCYPEIASIGKTERALKEAGVDYAVAKFPFAPMAKAKIEDMTQGFVKILYGKKYHDILGVHIVHAKATEFIAEFVLGKVLETTIDEIGQAIHPHPTLSETIMEAAHVANGAAIHL
jgi:dihydrolipoamide dehydrogenase